MCIPIAVAAVVASIAATAVSATAAIEQGQAQKDTANANAEAQRKAAISTENAAATQAYEKKQEARKIAAAGTAAAAAGGVDPTTGTALTLDTQTIGYGELDQLRIINNAQRTAWGYQAQGSIDNLQGNQAALGGYVQGGATLLGGASRAYFGSM